ncbi:MAG: acyltransferase [Fimbriimonadaceae bacterium]|nr:acyltransferase [Fimbriimonadaceae bacterium]
MADLATEPATPKPTRERAFDAAKGVLILAVVLHHCSTLGARLGTVEGSKTWWAIQLGSRALHFAVPTFLLLSMLLLARSEAGRERLEWGRFYRRRLEGLVVPYLVWWGIYVAVRLFVFRDSHDARTVSATWFGWHFQTYALLSSPRNLLFSLVFGKAWFHLYFLAVLIQAAAAFPVMFLAVRGRFRSLPSILITATVLQFGVYGIQKLVRFPTPASTFLWYLPALLVGVWLGTRRESLREQLAAWRPLLAVVAAASLAAYFWFGFLSLTGRSFESVWFNWAHQWFAVGTGLLLLDGFLQVRDWRGWGQLLWLGALSLPIYLLHPILLRFFERPPIRSWVIACAGAAPLVLAGAALLGSLMVTMSLVHARVSRVLFGRSL